MSNDLDIHLTKTTTTTTEMSTNTSESTIEHSVLIKTLIVTLMVIIVVGTLGNIINIVVFSKPNMRKGSTFRFLLYLAITDMLVLLVCSTDALSRFGFQWEIRAQSIFTCRVHTFLTYFLPHASSIILMVVSVDRALVVTNNTVGSIFKRVCFCFCRGNSNNNLDSPTNNKSGDQKKNGGQLMSVSMSSSYNLCINNSNNNNKSFLTQNLNESMGNSNIYQKENSNRNHHQHQNSYESYQSKSKLRVFQFSFLHHVDVVISFTVAFLVSSNKNHVFSCLFVFEIC